MKFQALRACFQTMSTTTPLLTILLAAALAVPAQQSNSPLLNDPANLAGERVSPPDLADTLPINHGAPALQQLLRKLRTRASFMLIVAHPDDEDGGLLTYLSRGQGARVAMLTLTRGEGGQNRMSADFDDALGLIRTQELLSADRYMGVDQFFGTEVDFGFSKTKQESFAKWTHGRVLYDAVRAVRLYRPLVIGAVFIGAPSDGHGQHQVSGQIAQEVFNAAGDPNVFPDQIAAGLPPWQPLKVYARAPFARIDAQGMYDYATSQYTPARFTNYVTGKVTTTVPKVNVVIPEGTPDPLLGGLSYVQFARQGLALQKTQIGSNARLASPGPHDVSYHRYGSHLDQPDGDDSGLEPSLFDGIDTSLPGIASLAPKASNKLRPALDKIDKLIAEAQHRFDPARPELAAPPLREALGDLDGFIHEFEPKSVADLPRDEKFNLLHELRIKRVQCNNALVLALGISVQANLLATNPTDIVLTSEPSIFAELKVSVLGDQPARITMFTLSGPDQTILETKDVPPSSTAITKRSTISFSYRLKSGLTPTLPYFSRPTIEQPFYDVSNPNLRNAPAAPPPFIVHTEFNSGGVPIFVDAAIANNSPSHPIQPAVLVPRLSVGIAPAVRIVSTHAANKAPFTFKAEVRANVAGIKPRLELNLPPGWAVTSPGDDFFLAHVNDAHVSNVTVVPGPVHPDQGDNGSQLIQAYALEPKLGDRAETNLGYRSVGYPSLTTTNIYRPATLRIVGVDFITAPDLNVAFLPGTGDDVPAALETLGVHVHRLTVADLTPQALKPYDAVVLGVRAYDALPGLAAANPALNAYAAGGGVVIVQYETGGLPEGTGPYPLSLGDSEKVVEEQNAVRILAPSHPLLTWPNRITSADFDNWVEERGHGFMATWDPRYTPLLETHDAGQQPQRGGLLVARTGKGAWIYLAYALYRQLPEGVPGAYRFLANLISLGKNANFKSDSPASK